MLDGLKEVRAAVEQARERKRLDGRRCLLFVDEVHRFNKAQQDAFLPHLEDGTLFLVGATTENPAFALNNALLSRARVYVLQPLRPQDLQAVIRAALADPERGLAGRGLQVEDAAISALAQAADGDARTALNLLEIAADLAAAETPPRIDSKLLGSLGGASLRRFDRGGDVFYDQISALHKSIRGSDPDAALYWLSRMLDAGCDRAYLARRLVRIASEDIGNADPRALEMALQAWDAFDRLGSPEGELALAQVFLACAAKSNAVYRAFQGAAEDVRRHGSLEVPNHLRNAPTRLSRELGHGEGYRYAHDEPDAFASGEDYFPVGMTRGTYYEPVERGLEIRIGERLRTLRARNRDNRKG